MLCNYNRFRPRSLLCNYGDGASGGFCLKSSFIFTLNKQTRSALNMQQHSPCGLLSEVKSIPGSVVVSVSTGYLYSSPVVSGVGVSRSKAAVPLSPPAGVGIGGGSVLGGA